MATSIGASERARLRRPEMSDADLAHDEQAVAADLSLLKQVLEWR